MESPTICEHPGCDIPGEECLDLPNHHVAFYCPEHMEAHGICLSCFHKADPKELDLGEGICNACQAAQECADKLMDDGPCDLDSELCDAPELEQPF